MYPKVDLEILANRRKAMRVQIRDRRALLVIDTANVSRPVVWAEDMWAKWKAISPFAKIAAIPLGIFMKRKVFPKSGGILGGLIRFAPMAFNIFKAMR